MFSDLDGTLLDHETYEWREAARGLEFVWRASGGLVLASSKTAREIDPLRADIGCSDWPAIVENGAGILWPGTEDLSGNGAYRKIRDLLQHAPPGFRGFGDMGPREVADITGLAPIAAENACARQFSEPGLWTGSSKDLDVFLQEIAKAGVVARRGGRFLTLSFGQTKADAMAEIVRALNPKQTIALGDAPNDLEMIQAADFGVIIANPAAPEMPILAGEAEGTIVRTKRAGPNGWADAVIAILSDPQKFRKVTGNG